MLKIIINEDGTSIPEGAVVISEKRDSCYSNKLDIDIKFNNIIYSISERLEEFDVIDCVKSKAEGNIELVQEICYKGKSYFIDVIAKDAFSKCNHITSIIIPDKTNAIGKGAFKDCGNLTSVVIPDSVTEIGSGAFDGCSSLTSIVIPDSVEYIWDHAFSGCSGLTSINIPDSVTSIEYNALSGCSSLTSINIPNSVTSIGREAFSGCSGLTSITIPNSVTSIGYLAFQNCSGLTSVTIPNSVTSIDYWAFSGCYMLICNFFNNSLCSDPENWGITFCEEETKDGLLVKDNIAVFCRKWATSVTIPDGVTSIGDGAFAGCTNLTSINIPDSVAVIGKYAFNGCTQLSNIALTASGKTIGIGAFDGCKCVPFTPKHSFDYAVLDFDNTEGELNDYGREGYDIVAVFPATEEQRGFVVMKRER